MFVGNSVLLHLRRLSRPEGVKKLRRVGDPAYNPEVMPLDSL